MAVVITRTANPAGVSASATVATYTGVSIGTAAPNRTIVVVVGTELAAANPSACTIDGNAMTAGTGGDQGAVQTNLFYLPYPTGTTANIAVTFSAVSPTSTQNHIAVYSVVGGTYSSKGGAQSTDMDSTAPLTTGSITIPTDGGFIAVAAKAADTVRATWANATEDLDVDAGGFGFTTATRTTALTTTAVTCTGATNGEDGAISWIIFGANTSPTTVLNSPADSATGVSTTPVLDFTGTDTESNDVRYEVQLYQPLVTDDFNRANENPIGGNWTNDALAEGANNQLKIVSNQLQAVTAATSCEAYWNANTFSGAMETYFTVVTKPGNTQRVALSFLQGPGASGWTGYQLVWQDNAGTDDLIIERCDSGGATTLVSATLEFNAGDVIAFSRSSTGVFTAWLNGLAIASTSADTTYTGAFYAAVTIRDTTGVLDNWGVRQILTDAVSGTDAGFANPDNGGDTDPFTSTENIQYTVQSALSNSTVYYWRVRGIDPVGTNTYGAWATTRSFTTGSSVYIPRQTFFDHQ